MPHAAKPVLFATGHAPAYRVGALARLHEREGIELALFGGAFAHGGAGYAGELPLPHRVVRPRELLALAASGEYRAVVVPTGGRLAPLAAWAGARRARVPVILWASLWAHPRTIPHAVTYQPLRRLYRSADAVVTYGPHVSSYVRARGAVNVHEAPQSVDNEFWGAPSASRPTGLPAAPWPANTAARFVFVGRAVREKGLDVLLAAWRSSSLAPAAAALAIVGAHPAAARSPDTNPATSEGVAWLGALAPQQLRAVYTGADVLVVPSIRTRTFREPWGLVVNEAMNQGLAVIATDAVGAAAGGLVRAGRNGVVVRAGDERALADALTLLAGDAELRARLGAAGREDVRAYSHDAWAAGFSAAFASVDVSRERC